MDAIIDLLRTIIYWLSTFIYKLIIDIYDIFLTLCNSRLLDNEVMAIIAQRVGLILGLIMLFILMFSVVQMILEPDKLTDKEKGVGNIAKKIIIVIVMLGVSQGAFSLLYGVQKTVIKSNIIGKFLIPYETDLENFGGSLSGQLFTSFYNVDQNVKNSSPTNVDKIAECEIAYEDLLLEISDKNFSSGKYCLNEKTKITGEKDEVYIMDLHPLLLPIAGGAALFFLFTYCITVGVRTVQLAFLEIIAPMAIISYLSPKKDTMFQKWWKLYFATYLDVFIRIAIISLAVFLIAVIFSSDMKGAFLESIDGKDGILIKVIMIFAILTFAKKAPDLIKDLFPSSASKLGLGMTSPKKLFDDMLYGNYVKGAAKVATAGTLTGAIGAGISAISRFNTQKKLTGDNKKALKAALFGATTGFGRGLVAGGKKGGVYSNLTNAVSKQHEVDDKYEQLVEGGGTIGGMIRSKVSSTLGKTPAQKTNRIINNMKALVDYYGEMKKYSNDLSCVKTAQSAANFAVKEDAVYENDEQYNIRITNAKNRYQNLINTISKAKENKESSFVFEGRTFDLSTETGLKEYQEVFKDIKEQTEDKSRRMIKAAETDAEFIARKSKYEEKVRKMRAAAEQAIVEKANNYREVEVEDDDGNKHIDYQFDFTFDGVTETITLTGDDIAKAGAIRTVAKEANYYSTSHKVERYDTKEKRMVEVGEINSASKLKQMEEYMNETVNYVKDEDYFKHKAEDAAAGVKDSGK